MIQNYLKTGMVFYDSKDKQHFRSACCKETFFHYTDEGHFPSYQIFTDTILDLTGGELITNGNFANWDGAADPNNFPIGWTLVLNDANNYVTDAGGQCQIISNDTSDINIQQTILTIGKWYVFRVNITDVTAGSLRMSDNGATQGTWNTTGEKTIVFQAVATTIVIRRLGVTNITFTDVSVREYTQRFDIYDLKDNPIGEWETNTPGTSVFNFLTGGNNIIHDYRDDVIFPGFTDNETGYYLRITINPNIDDEYWYSEAFKICKCDIALTDCDTKELSLYDTEERGSNINVLIFIGAAGPQLFYYNKKTYGCWMQRIGAGYSCENMVYAINHSNCNISDSYNVGIGTVDSLETHLFAALVVADDGHIVIAHEKSKNATANGHNSTMYVKRSDNPEDETSWINAIAHIADYYVEVGNDTNPRLAYPSMDKMADGKIFLICRYSTVSNLDHISVHRSDDDGVSWGALGGGLDGGYEIVDMQYAPDGDIMTYKGLCSHPSSNTVYLFFKCWDAPADVQPDLYFLLSSDNGVTWESIDGVLSQDITVAGAITRAQLDAGNGRVFNLAGAGSKIYHMSGVITDSGVPYLAVLRATDAAPDYLLYIYYWNGAAWIGVNTTIPVSTTDLSGVTILERENKIEIIALTEETSGWKWRVYHALKTDLTDWTIIETIGDTYDGTTVLWSGLTFNYTETDCEIFNYTEPTDPNWRDFNILAKCAESFIFCDMLTLSWWSDCDWDDIIYQFGYRNSLVLNTQLDNPSEDIVINPEERQGKMFVRDVIIKKRYKFTIRIPEYLWNALIRLPAYGSEMPNFHAWITLPDGSFAPMSEVAIMGDWDVGNCMNTFTIDFVDDEYPVVADNCCDNADVSEI